MQRLSTWFNANRTLIANSGSMVGSTALATGLGFVYWWLAARYFSETTIGIASSNASTMLLLGSLAIFGLGTLIVREMSQHPGEELSLLTTFILVTGGISLVVALVCAWLFSGTVELRVVAQNPVYTLMFALGVALSAVSLLLDQAYIGLLRSYMQFWRNLVASVIKIIILIPIGLTMQDRDGLLMFSSWVIGLLIAIVIPLVSLRRSFPHQKMHFQSAIIRRLFSQATMHHFLNIALEAPLRMMPVVVTLVLSAATSAGFYFAWMLAGLLFFPIQSLTLVLYAVGAQDAAGLAEKTRFTMRTAFAISLLGYLGVFVLANVLMSLFGKHYADEAANVLRLVSLAAFPYIIKDHYIAIHRVHSDILPAAIVSTLGAALEFALAVIGAQHYGLNGLCLGWLLAVLLEAIYMYPSIRRTTAPAAVAESPL